MIKVIQPRFLVEVFGVESHIAFGGAGLGELVAEGVVVAGGYGGLSLVRVNFVDGSHLVFDVGIPAVGMGEEVGGGFRELDVAFYRVFADAVGVATDGGERFVELHCQVVTFPVEVGDGSVDGFGEAAAIAVVGVGGGGCGR